MYKLKRNALELLFSAAHNTSITQSLSSTSRFSKTYRTGNHIHCPTFRVRRYVVISTQPVHRLQIRPKCATMRVPHTIPQVTSGSAQ